MQMITNDALNNGLYYIINVNIYVAECSKLQ